MIATLAVLGYVLVGVLISRPVYGRLRKGSIDNCLKRYAALYQRSSYGPGLSIEYYGFDHERWNQLDRPMIVFSTFLFSICWPGLVLIPVGYGIYRYMTGSKIMSQVEMDVERDRLNNRIKELETELGIK